MKTAISTATSGFDMAIAIKLRTVENTVRLRQPA